MRRARLIEAASRPRPAAVALLLVLVPAMLLAAATPTLAADDPAEAGSANAASEQGWWDSFTSWDWEGSKAEAATAKGLDALIVRPLASARVLIGGVLFLPAAALASPGGREGIDGAYDVLLSEPMEYAFERELGDF